MLEWLGDEGNKLQKAFVQVFGSPIRPFGSRALQIGGLSDDNKGVQWNAWYDPRSRAQCVGVNLEGMQYGNWPISRLITRELRNPELLSVIRKSGATDPAQVLWARDYWQAAARPKILEAEITPTPILLSQIDEEGWHQSLIGALDCLDAFREWRGRATQNVTLAGSGKQIKGQVSPHLTLFLPATAYTPWPSFLSEAKTHMQPFYDWAMQQAASWD